MNFGDEELMAMFAAGVTEAFDMLFERYRNRVYRFALGCLRSRPDAEDVVQEVFLRVAGTAVRYRPQGRFRAWLFQITANRIRTAVVRRGRVAGGTAAGQSPGAAQSAMEEAPCAERRLLAREVIEGALGELTDAERMVVMLREVEGLDGAMTAEAAGLSPENVRVLLHRSRRKLVSFLERYKEANGHGQTV